MVSANLASRHRAGEGGRHVRSSLGHGWNLEGVRRGVFLGVLLGVLLAEPLLLFLPFFFPMVAAAAAVRARGRGVVGDKSVRGESAGR